MYVAFALLYIVLGSSTLLAAYGVYLWAANGCEPPRPDETEREPVESD